MPKPEKEEVPLVIDEEEEEEEEESQYLDPNDDILTQFPPTPPNQKSFRR